MIRAFVFAVFYALTVSMAAGQTEPFRIDTSKTTHSIFSIDTVTALGYFTKYVEPQVVIHRYEYILYWDNDQLRRGDIFGTIGETSETIPLRKKAK